MTDENKGARPWLVVWHPQVGLHMIAAPVTTRVQMAGSSRANDTLRTMYQDNRLQILESLFCKMFQVTKIEDQLASVAVVNSIPPIWKWPDGADGNNPPQPPKKGSKPSKKGSAGGSVSSRQTINLEPEDEPDDDDGGIDEYDIESTLSSLVDANTWTKDEWRAHINSMSQKCRTIDNLFESPTLRLPTDSVSCAASNHAPDCRGGAFRTPFACSCAADKYVHTVAPLGR